MIVAVKFNKNDKKVYTYRVDPKQGIQPKVGDQVAVMAGQYKVVQVTKIIVKPTDEQLKIATKFVVDVIDTNYHRKRVADATDSN